MKQAPVKALSTEQRQEVASWIEKNLPSLPEPVRIFLAPHQKYLAAKGDVQRRHFDATFRELRRAMRITPSSERRRSGNPLASLPKSRTRSAKSEQERVAQQRDRSRHLSGWHDGLKKRHTDKAERLEEKLAKMKTKPLPRQTSEPDQETEQELLAQIQKLAEETPVEEIELTKEQEAESEAAAEKFVERLDLGDGADEALQSVNETLMPGGAVTTAEGVESLTVVLPEELAEAKVVKTLIDQRVRYDISVAVKRIALDVEKQVVVKENGERAVISASTAEYGPAHYSVTWSALATLAVLVGQFALPLNRLATMLSTVGKRFTAGGLSRMLHYVAERLVPIYLELAEQLADSNILAGDDTSCRVIEVNSYFTKMKGAGGSKKKKKKPPWANYRTRAAANESVKRCEQLRQARMQRRAEGDRKAKRTPDEGPSLGMLLGRVLEFESPRQDGSGTKQSMNTTVITGRSVADDPCSLIVFYRSHLGGCGNLLESVLQNRSPSARDLILQADLSTTNLVRDPQLLERFNIRLTGCSAHYPESTVIWSGAQGIYAPGRRGQLVASKLQITPSIKAKKDNLAASRMDAIAYVDGHQDRLVSRRHPARRASSGGLM